VETDFRQRYNHAVPTDRLSTEVPLSGELTRQEALQDKLFATVPEAIVVLDTAVKLGMSPSTLEDRDQSFESRQTPI
jgi:hypothetical protein